MKTVREDGDGIILSGIGCAVGYSAGAHLFPHSWRFLSKSACCWALRIRRQVGGIGSARSRRMHGDGTSHRAVGSDGGKD